MADHHHHHHQQHRPNRLSVPSRTGVTVGRAYSSFPYTPTPTPSKTRLSRSSHGNTKSSVSFLFLILFSLRSLYSLLPFLRSSPSFSLFPFSFLVSLLSFLFSLTFSLFSSFSPSKKDNFFRQNRAVFSLTSLSLSQFKLLLAKSLLLAVVFLLRFQALRYCGAAAMILAELSGNVSARVLSDAKTRNSSDKSGIESSKIRGFCILFAGLLLLSISWDRIDCFPFSSSSIKNWGFWLNPNCTRIWPMLLPFLSGFLACYEKVSMNCHEIKQLDQKRVRLLSLFLTTLLLFFPALVSFLLSDEDGVSLGNLSLPLANTVVFGVLLSEIYCEDKFRSSKDTLREFLVTFLCTIVLELFYFPELSLWGLLLCGFLLYIAVRELGFVSSDYQEIGMESPESFSTMFMKPIRHILSEKKSRKIALFLLINTGYMVVEFVAGFMSNSLGLISDACHMLFDCAALAIGLYASYISRLPANHQFNYGRGRFEVLSGYVNAVFLVLVGALIVLESIERILDPQEISTNSLLVVSVGGLLVNVVGLIFFHEEHHHAHGGSGCSHSQPHSHKHHKTILLHNSGTEAAQRLENDHNHGHQSHDCSHGHEHGQHSHEVSHGHGHGQHSHEVRHGHRHCHDHHSHVVNQSNGNGHLSHDGSCGKRHDHNSHDVSHNHGNMHDHHNQDGSHGRGHDNCIQDGSHGHGHDHHSQDISHKAEHDHLSQDISHKPKLDHKSQDINHGSRHNHQSQEISHEHKRDHHGQDVSHRHGNDQPSHKLGHNHNQHISNSPAHDHHSQDVSQIHRHGQNHHNQDISLYNGNGHHSHECSHSHEDHTHSNHNQEDNKQHHHVDHNMEGIFLHVLADTMGSVGVVISTLLIKYKGWLVADPASSIFISILIIASVIPLLRNSAEILLQRVPKPHERSLKEAMKKILKTKGVCSIQRLHVWSLTNSEVVATLHLQVSMDSEKKMDTKLEVSRLLEDAGVKDLTLQVESVSL